MRYVFVAVSKVRCIFSLFSISCFFFCGLPEHIFPKNKKLILACNGNSGSTAIPSVYVLNIFVASFESRKQKGCSGGPDSGTKNLYHEARNHLQNFHYTNHKTIEGYSTLKIDRNAYFI